MTDQLHILAFSLEFFQGGKIYCYANFYCYSIVFRPNFREVQKFSRGGQTALGGTPLWEKASIQKYDTLQIDNPPKQMTDFN